MLITRKQRIETCIRKPVYYAADCRKEMTKFRLQNSHIDEKFFAISLTRKSKTLLPSMSKAIQTWPWYVNQSSIRTHRLQPQTKNIIDQTAAYLSRIIEADNQSTACQTINFQGAIQQ